MTPSNKVLVGKGIIDGLVEYSIRIRIIHWKSRDTVGQQIFEPSFKGRHDTISHWSGGMVAREMLFEVQECFSTGSSASFAGTAEHVVDILLDKVSKVLASEAPAVNAIVDLGKVVKGRSPFVSKFR